MKKAILLATCCFLMACASTLPEINKDDIARQMKTVNTTDGVNREEAVIIAKEYMVKNGYDYDWNIIE